MTPDEPLDPDRSKLWLVRHGETEWSESGRHTGWTDIPLTAAGREQAAGLGEALAGHDFTLVLSSPLSRALDTARLAGFADRVEVTDDLREWNYGAYEGRTTAEIRVERPGWAIWNEGPLAGETLDEVAVRVDRVIARVRAADGDSLAFAHAHLLRILAARWLGLAPERGHLFALATATVSVLAWEREQPVIEHWNQARRA